MVNPDNYSETTVVDEFYEIEVAVLNEDRCYCPAKKCQKQFTFDRIGGGTGSLTQHLRDIHGWDLSKTKTCLQCGDEFTVDKWKSDQMYCSPECSYDAQHDRITSKEELLNDIREQYDIDEDGDTIRKPLVEAIHEDVVGGETEVPEGIALE